MEITMSIWMITFFWETPEALRSELVCLNSLDNLGKRF